jgi:hypothetical protein
VSAGDDRTRALQDIVSLAQRHRIAVPEIAAALSASSPPGAPTLPASPALETRARGVLVRVLGYLGGTFVFAGIGVFVALQWDHMNAAARIVVTLGPGIVAFVLAMLAARDERFDKAVAPLFLIAAAMLPTGMLVAFNELGSGGDWRWATLITFGVVGLQFAAAFGTCRRSTSLFFTLFFGMLFWWNALDLVDASDHVTELTMGGAMLLAAIGVDRTAHAEITPVWYLFGASVFLYGFFDVVENTVFELSFLAVAAGFVYAAAALRSRTLLFVSTIAVLAYTGWYTGEHFANSIGWPLALIAFGLLMIAVSALAVRIDRQYVRPRVTQ